MFIFKNYFHLVYDNEGDAGDEGEGNAGSEGNAGGTGEGKKITLTQDELNKMMADNKRKLTKQNEELVTQLKKLRDETRMSEENRADLETRIEQLQEQYMSKEELARREAEKASKRHKQEVENLTGERDSWRGRYTIATIQRSLTDAAVTGEAIRPEQIVSILGNSTHLGEVLDATGQPTGEYKTLVRFKDVNDSGERVTLELSPEDAIKRMKELPDLYGNLFKGAANSGMGGAGSQGSETTASMKDILSDPVKYREWRKKNPDLDISKLRK
jgi:hypothetical protein